MSIPSAITDCSLSSDTQRINPEPGSNEKAMALPVHLCTSCSLQSTGHNKCESPLLLLRQEQHRQEVEELRSAAVRAIDTHDLGGTVLLANRI